jgi:UDP-N-acetylenolpyruvoylglucosamine reductase
MTLPTDILERPMADTLHIADEIAGLVSLATVVRRDEPLAGHTTLRVGGPADVYVEPASEADLAGVVKFCGVRGVPFFVIGRGSNLLVRDGGFRGAVICLSHANFAKIEFAGERLRCGAGAKLKNVAVEARRNGLSGMEFLEGIPGSVGGALRMNAGAMGSQTFDVVESVRLMDFDGGIQEFTPEEMSVKYRGCATLKDNIALGAVFRGRADSPESIAQRISAFSQKRWATQPAAPSAGCAFKNPPSITAG